MRPVPSVVTTTSDEVSARSRYRASLSASARSAVDARTLVADEPSHADRAGMARPTGREMDRGRERPPVGRCEARLEADDPVGAAVHRIVEPVQDRPPCRVVDEDDGGLVVQDAGGASQQLAGRAIRFDDDPVGVRDEIPVRREVEQLAVAGHLGIELLLGQGQRLVLRADLLRADLELEQGGGELVQDVGQGGPRRSVGRGEHPLGQLREAPAEGVDPALDLGDGDPVPLDRHGRSRSTACIMTMAEKSGPPPIGTTVTRQVKAATRGVDGRELEHRRLRTRGAAGAHRCLEGLEGKPEDQPEEGLAPDLVLLQPPHARRRAVPLLDQQVRVQHDDGGGEVVHDQAVEASVAHEVAVGLDQ